MAETVISREEQASRASSLPWTQAFIEALPVAPAWGGLALAAGQFSCGLLYLSLAGEPLRVLPDAIFALLVGAAPEDLEDQAAGGKEDDLVPPLHPGYPVRGELERGHKVVAVYGHRLVSFFLLASPVAILAQGAIPSGAVVASWMRIP